MCISACGKCQEITKKRSWKPFAGGIPHFNLFRLPFVFSLFAEHILWHVVGSLRRTTSHAAVDTYRPYCGVAGGVEPRQRMDDVCSLPLVPFPVGNYL